MSNIQILGAYGAKSAKGGSSAFLLNTYHVLDAGNLLRPLREKSAELKSIWITHSHLDHISDIAYILDNYYELRTEKLILRALPETLAILKEHFFNHKIWPDFSEIPLADGSDMSLGYEAVKPLKSYTLGNDESIYAFKTDHTVPSCGYVIEKNKTSVLISADTYSLEGVIDVISKDESIRTLVLECSFPIALFDLAKASKHLTAQLLFERLKPLEAKGLKLYINHLKPSYEKQIKEEIKEYQKNWDVHILDDGDIISF